MSFRDSLPFYNTDSSNSDSDSDSDSFQNFNLDRNQQNSILSNFQNENINLNNMSNPQNTVGPIQVPVLKPEYLKMIPEFNGETEFLPSF